MLGKHLLFGEYIHEGNAPFQTAAADPLAANVQRMRRM